MQNAYESLFVLRKSLPEDTCIVITRGSISICKKADIELESTK